MGRCRRAGAVLCIGLLGAPLWTLALQVQERPEDARAVFEEAGGAGEGGEERISDEQLLQFRRLVFTATQSEAFRRVDADGSGQVSFGEMMLAFGFDATEERAVDGLSRSAGLSQWRRANKERLDSAASVQSVEFSQGTARITGATGSPDSGVHLGSGERELEQD